MWRPLWGIFHKSCQSSYPNVKTINQHLRFLDKQNESHRRSSYRLIERFAKPIVYFTRAEWFMRKLYMRKKKGLWENKRRETAFASAQQISVRRWWVFVKSEIIESAESQPTVLIGEDTDLLVLLLYHTKQDCKPIFFHSEAKSRKTGGRLWDILTAKLKLGDTLCDEILFLHAFLGHDSTSRIYGIGKSTPLDHMKQKKKLPGFCHIIPRFQLLQKTTLEKMGRRPCLSCLRLQKMKQVSTKTAKGNSSKKCEVLESM